MAYPEDIQGVRSYPDVQNILIVDPITTTPPRQKYKFFQTLERSVYEGGNTEGFRRIYNLAVPSQDETYKGFHSGGGGQPKEIQKKRTVPVPYWEIHYYEDGFLSPSATAFPNWFDPATVFSVCREKHFYFTLRSLINDESYDALTKADLISSSKLQKVYEPGVEVLKRVGDGHASKIEYNYTGKALDQRGGIDIFILSDELNNFEALKKWMPPEIWDCLTNGNTIPDYKPSDLPRMMFLAYGSTFIAKTENVDSIVCMDRFTHIGTNEKGENLKIKGNIFINEGTIVSPTRYVKTENPLYVGKNCVFGMQGTLYPETIGDNVVTGDDVSVDAFNTALRSNCIITKGVKICTGQKVLANMITTARLPLFLGLIKGSNGIDTNDFYRVAKIRREAYLSGQLPGF